ncbi:AAA family ATPase [Candidatus Competibacter phosphatis]|uniref:AAA family ATPase n=1 Tax=Candidatus Competibacter phosphatis TaxID=221280 RepID=A0ABX1TK63_9GAMM|nr:AAA family ATPase [Candidatus Competibacter phosphatis]NMQ19783.1 AAA family ATPase [Candidatus Competibacter phosphatis]
MRFPYGIADFRKIREEGYFYVDRSDRIALLEEAGSQLLFLRPRRFGKSLWLSTLENYYDLARTDDFERLFGGLKIGRNPTPLRNRYFVLKLNFSVVDPSGDHAAIRRALFDHVNTQIENLVAGYAPWLRQPVRIQSDNAMTSLQSLLGAVSQTPHRLYLLIDEYDNFANEVMISPLQGTDRYQELVESEGTIKTFFKAVKAGAEGRGIDRVFLTGVSPVVLSDITSGYNVAKDLTHLDEYHDLCGFTARELADALSGVLTERGIPAEQAPDILELLQRFYNGYRFGEGDNPLLYNPTLALYFLDYFGRYGRYPRQMLDDNLAMDRNRIQYVARLPHGETLVNQALNDAKPLAVAQLVNRFGVRDMLTAPKNPDFLATLLYYFGVLTLAGRNEWGELSLTIPNQVIRKLYVERLQEQLLPDYDDQAQRQELCRRFYATGDLGPLCDLLERTYFKVFDNRDLRWSNELVVKTAFLVVLFNDVFYVMDSEPALGRGYGDLLLRVRSDMRQYALLDHLLEFKTVSLKEAGLSGADLAAKTWEELRALPVVAEQLREAEMQLTAYRETLKRTDGESLKLRTHAVVSIGLERLVW